MGKNQLSKKVELSKAKKEIEKIIAQEVSYEIEAGFEKIIDAFYADYEPVVYERTYSTYLASSNANDLSRVENSNRGGIIVAGSNIPGQPYYNHWGVNKGKSMNTEWVFERTYNGIHGLTGNNYFSLKKGDYSENIQKKDRTKYDAEFYRKTKNKSEKAYFRMSPIPRKIMRDAFDSFKKGKGKMRPDSKDSHTISQISDIAITEYLKKHPIF